MKIHTKFSDNIFIYIIYIYFNLLSFNLIDFVNISSGNPSTSPFALAISISFDLFFAIGLTASGNPILFLSIAAVIPVRS